ncbi:hypothetical protein LEP1GSC137_2403 [Leptospira borgpetersenii str. Noumea 25]|uniref:Uncharacterized protein n=1 Tax=Leptospira borgpetersenii serovar Ballum TaxID=280505 RepID=A0A0S2IUE6_LEPBO|nr:hypothetical protein LBBP_03061 [Leptospira borgpetersenii serovar Ballum]EKQ99462.1 hypothetical protein LEP1GSC121_2230 [Leptospira borgpetersenii serovar Castellonis str. 200801910]EMO09689.1 hypothetical protein LEP1GSC137_2403 [Leptospira borgpetersenii str. Noumea 25]
MLKSDGFGTRSKVFEKEILESGDLRIFTLRFIETQIYVF